MYRCSTACKHRVSGSLSLPSRGPFHLSFTVLCAIGHGVVSALSDKVSRVSSYSGYRHVILIFAYGTFTLCGWSSQGHSANLDESFLRSEPRSARTSVWALPISLAATFGIDVSFFSSGYLDVSVHRVPGLNLWIQLRSLEVCSSRFPHSEISGS